MKTKSKIALAVLLSIVAAAFVTGCSFSDSPYEINDNENYTVSVKYDANGGTFTTNTSVIVDSYNVSELPGDENSASVALISPDDENRNHDAFTATKKDYFLAGWYATRTETTDSEGNTVYTYSDKWDFEEDRLIVDKTKELSSAEPILTLYAAWVPLFEIEFYSLDSDEPLNSYIYNPTTVDEILLPAWDMETGAIEMFDFPQRNGYTFNGAYYDKDATQAVEGEAVVHPGTIDYETGTATNNVLKLYIDWTEGEWYHIYNAEQFVENASVNGHYEIHADLDFTDENWPTSFMYNNFAGEIVGNGHTMKNIEVVQTNNSKVNAGLFGQITEDAAITDITFDNVTFTIKAGTRVVGTSYGLFAGTMSANARLENINILNSTLAVDSSCYFGADDYTIGLVCGMGDPTVIANADIECIVTGDTPESMSVKVEGNSVTVETVTE